MNCTPVNIDSAHFCPELESKTSGINAVVQIIPYDSIDTFPVIGTDPGQPNINVITNMEKLVSMGGDIVLAANKSSFILPCEIEKNSLSITSQKGSFNSTLTVRLQNSTHNRGVVSQMKKMRFIAVVKDLATGDKILVGRYVTGDSQFAAKLNPEFEAAFGQEFDSDRDITLSIEAKKYVPATFYGRIKASYLYTELNSAGSGDIKFLRKGNVTQYFPFFYYNIDSITAWEDGNESTPLTINYELVSATIGILDPNDDEDTGYILDSPLNNPLTPLLLDLNSRRGYWNDALNNDAIEYAIKDNLLISLYDEF